MKTATDFLDAVKKKHGLTSDYQLAKFLGWSQQRITKYRTGKSPTFDDEAAARVAEALELDPGYVAVCMAAHRAQTPAARKMWERVAKTVSAGSALTLALFIAYALAPDSMISDAQAFVSADKTVYYVKLASLVFAIVSVSYLYFAHFRPDPDRGTPNSRGTL